jgi:succinate dehydrogenase / fumarate reductase cytochrome b subunit
MNAVMSLTQSTVGKKVVMASTGLLMVGFVTGHMVGNLQIFLGEEVLDDYGAKIKGLGEFLWIIRASLLAFLVAHVVSAIALVRQARAARATGYQGGRTPQAATFASRSLRWGGVAILLYIAFHLSDISTGLVNPEWVKGEVYNNVTSSLQRPGVAAIYLLANLALGLHLYHGVYSIFNTLGINQIGTRDTARQAGMFFAFAVAGGNILITLAVVTRFVGTVTP